MPQNRNNGTPPPVMTWPKAAPVLGIAVLFDVLRTIFEWFFLFGPAFAAIAANAAVGGGVFGSIAGAGAALFAGTIGAPAIEAFGVVMAMAVGLAGWMTIGLILALKNRRIFKANSGNTLWYIAGLMVSEVPFVGTLPAFTVSMWRMYRAQIQRDQAALKAYQASQAALQSRQAQQQQQAALAQMQMQAQQEAANDAAYAKQEEHAEEETAAEAPTNVLPFPPAKTREPLVGVPQYTKKAA